MFILHHFQSSPWSEILRLAFGLKRMAWGSVEIPVMLPKPQLVALTGGYARTPVLQNGADLYCDTLVAMDAIEAACPAPSLYPEPLGEAHRLLAVQAGGQTFIAAVGAALGGMPAAGMEAFWADREKRFGLNGDAFRAIAPQLRTQFKAQVALLEAALGSGKQFLGGDKAGHADLAHYMLLWFQKVRTGGDLAPVVAGLPRIAAWAQRVAALGHGTPTAMSAADAIAAARDATPAVAASVKAESGFAVGQKVLVSQEGSKDAAVEGRLQVLNARTIVLLRTSAEAGEVAVHFPRLGQVLRAL